MPPLDPEWFVQKSHYHFIIEEASDQNTWHIREEHLRRLAPDYAARLLGMGGKQMTPSPETEYWLFPRSAYPREEQLLSALNQAVGDADQEREQLARQFEAGELAIFETKVKRSTVSSRWIVSLQAATKEGIMVPIRLPQSEQGDETVPSFPTPEAAQAYAAHLEQTYAPHLSHSEIRSWVRHGVRLLLASGNQHPTQHQVQACLERRQIPLSLEQIQSVWTHIDKEEMDAHLHS